MIVNSTGHLGGSEKILLGFLKGLDKSAFNFFAVLPSEGKFSDLLRHKGMAVAIIEKLYKGKFVTRDDSPFLSPFLTIKSLSNIITFSNAISRHIRQNDIKLVITNGVKACIAGGIAAKCNGIGSIWIIQDILPPNIFRGGFNLCARLFPGRIIAISNAVKNIFPKSIHKKIEIVYPYLEQGEFDGVKKARALRGELNIKDDDIVFGSIGKILPSKGIDIFLEAISRIKKAHPNVKALIAGDSRLEAAPPDYIYRLKAFAKSQGLDKDAIFIGWRDDIYNVLATIDVLVHTPSRPEGFGRVLIEAMAASKPIVAFDQGAVREIIEDGISGMLVKALDQKALAGSLVGLLKDEGKRKSLGDAARRRVEKYFSGIVHL